ncbi:MAG: D-alanyl-D-alanine carboxypeptidase family protein [Lachnospirales bacterium]
MRKYFIFILIFVMTFNTNIYAEDNSGGYKSSILMEVTTGKVLTETNSMEHLKIASVTKVMTILLVFEAIDSGRIQMSDIVTVSDHASSMGGSQVFLEPMEKQTVEDLLKSVIIASANDASVALAEYLSGTEEKFVEAMNQRAKELGMENTVYVNACGLDDENEQYSTAYDVALVTRELTLNHPKVFDYTTIWQDEIIHKTSRGDEPFGLTNTNKFIRNYDGATGLKTGSTSEALFCLSGTATRDGLSLITVVLGADSADIRTKETIKLMDYGFSNFKVESGEQVDKVISTLPIYKGEVDTVDIYVKENVSTLVSKNSGEITKEAYVIDNLKAPILAGSKVGEIVYKQGDTVVNRVDLIVKEDVGKASYYINLKKLLPIWF